MTPGGSQRGVAWRRWRPLISVVVVVALAALIHAHSLSFGFFLDDWPHLRQLRESDWSIGGLTYACRLELVGGILDVWWLPQFTLRFFRPVAFGLMKLAYTLNGWNAASMHAVSIGWHLLVCALLMRLLRRCGVAWSLSLGITGLFAIHPAHAVTVQWIACQSELIVTALILAATLAAFNYFGWAQLDAPIRTSPPAGAPPVARWPWAVISLALFALALGARENAVMFPVVLLLTGVWRPAMGVEAGAAAATAPADSQKRAAVFFGATVLIAAGYLATRWYFLAGAALPPRPYVVPPTAPDFLPYVFDKTCYYLLGEFLAVPCVPISGLDYVRLHPGLLYGGGAFFGIVLLVAGVYFRRRRPGPLGPAWLLFFMAPVLPAFESPHHLYLPSVGWALTTATLSNLSYADEKTGRPRRRAWQVVVWLIVLGAGGLYGGFAYVVGVTMDASQQIEARMIQEVIEAPGGIHDGDRLYFANMPVMGHYVAVAVAEKTGARDLRASALTWSPRMLGVHCPTELNWIDRRTAEIRIEEGRYFAGPLGELAAQMSGRTTPIDRGVARLHNGMRIELLERDAAGIKALRFTLDQPADGPGVHFFWGSRTRWACPLKPELTPDE